MTIRVSLLVILAWILIAIQFVSFSHAISFSLRQTEETCLDQEVVPGDYITGQFSVGPQNSQISVSVKDPNNDLVYMRPGISDGVFAYTASKTGSYKACFQNNLTPGLKSVKFTYSVGQLQDGLEKVRTDDIKSAEQQVIKIQKLVNKIKTNEQWLQTKQTQMNELNESIGFYVILFNIILLIVVVGGYVVQLVYLKKFFRGKRLIQ